MLYFKYAEYSVTANAGQSLQIAKFSPESSNLAKSQNVTPVAKCNTYVLANFQSLRSGQCDTEVYRNEGSIKWCKACSWAIKDLLTLFFVLLYTLQGQEDTCLFVHKLSNVVVYAVWNDYHHAAQQYKAWDDLCRRKGIASRLVQWVIQKAEADDCRAVYLHTIDYNDAAIHMYTSNGFKHIATRKDFYYIR